MKVNFDYQQAIFDKNPELGKEFLVMIPECLSWVDTS